jgi:glycerophosphoryl diester phosphodiesterase
LDETLDIMPRDIWLNVHLKEGRECGEAAARAIAKADRLHQAFLACNASAADGARAAVPDMLICNMERQGGAVAYVDGTIAQKAQFIQLTAAPAGELPGLVAKAKAHGIRVNYFGQEKPDQLRALFAAGVEFPLANDVAAALRVAKECGIEPHK